MCICIHLLYTPLNKYMYAQIFVIRYLREFFFWYTHLRFAPCYYIKYRHFGTSLGFFLGWGRPVAFFRQFGGLLFSLVNKFKYNICRWSGTYEDFLHFLTLKIALCLFLNTIRLVIYSLVVSYWHEIESSNVVSIITLYMWRVVSTEMNL